MNNNINKHFSKVLDDYNALKKEFIWNSTNIRFTFIDRYTTF